MDLMRVFDMWNGLIDIVHNGESNNLQSYKHILNKWMHSTVMFPFQLKHNMIYDIPYVNIIVYTRRELLSE